MKKITLLVAAVIISAAGLLVYHNSVQATGTGKASKICSAVVPGNWRNDIPVPPQWTGSDCGAWAASIGANMHQLACITSSGVIYGPGAMAPSPNCGW